jgi:selenocysteine-specific elongation factor
MEATRKKKDPLKVSKFDAIANSWPSSSQSEIKGILVIKDREVSVSAYLYEEAGKKAFQGQYFVRMHASQPLSLYWNDPFKILDRKSGTTFFEGRVLYPFEGETKQKEIKKRLELLQELMGDEKGMVLAKTRLRGVKGLAERELAGFSSLSKDTLLKLSRQLEGEGKVRILSFSPLFLLSQESFNFLCARILAFLTESHEKHPEDFGVLPERIQKRFGLPQRILILALKHLSREGQISENGKNIALRDFHPQPSPEEEELLEDMEEMYLEGELQSVSLEELQKRFRLSRKRLNRMLSFLVERRKIVLGKDGFLLHSKWLDEVIQAVRSSEKNELSVSDFKQMTGLTRKYAIPLLELLDRMGVTRRKGSIREIIQDVDDEK